MSTGPVDKLMLQTTTGKTATRHSTYFNEMYLDTETATRNGSPLVRKRLEGFRSLRGLQRDILTVSFGSYHDSVDESMRELY